MLADAKATSGFAVPDTDEAKRFYGETLGLEVAVLDEENGVMALKLTGGDIFVYRKPDFVPATYTILNFEVDDIDAAVDDLSSRGVSFERYDGFEQDEKGISPWPRPPHRLVQGPGRQHPLGAPAAGLRQKLGPRAIYLPVRLAFRPATPCTRWPFSDLNLTIGRP